MDEWFNIYYGAAFAIVMIGLTLPIFYLLTTYPLELIITVNVIGMITILKNVRSK